MSYKITRSNHILDSITVEDNGQELTISVDLVVDDILAGYNKALRAIQEAQEQAEGAKGGEDPDAIEHANEALGKAVVALFGLIFGEEQTERIVDFYTGRYLEMLGDFIPYITQEIMPKVQQAKNTLAKRYTAWKK